MKKNIYKLFIALFATIAFTACTEDEGTDPGNDSNPMVTIYRYAVSPPFNADNDILLRLAANSTTSEAYYLVEKVTDKENRIASIGEEGYKDYVVSNGVKVNDISGASNVDVTLTGMIGEYAITVVAVGAGKKTAKEIVFVGLEWESMGEGTINSQFFKDTWAVEINKAKGQEIYELIDPYFDGYNIRFSLKSDGTVNTLADQNTGYLYSSSYGYAWVRYVSSKRTDKTLDIELQFRLPTAGVAFTGTFIETIVFP